MEIKGENVYYKLWYHSFAIVFFYSPLKGNYSAACRIQGKTIKFCKMQNVLPYQEIA